MMQLIRVLVTSLAILVLAGGCSPDAPAPASQPTAASTPASSPSAAKQVDSLSGAPQELRAMLRWAEDELAKTPAAVPLPNSAKLAEPKWPVIRLDDRFATAKVSGEWTAPQTVTTPIASLGPFRSDKPDRAFAVGKVIDPEEGESRKLTMGGLQLERETIGAIEVQLKLPFGSYFDLRWGKGSNIRVPIDNNKEFVTLRVTSEGFPDWTGPLAQLVITTEGLGEPTDVIEIAAVRFFGQATSYPELAGTRRVKLNREIRSSIYSHGPSEVRFEGVKIPSNAKLQVGLGTVRRRAVGTEADPVKADIVVDEGGKQSVVQSTEISQLDTWNDLSVDLSGYSGKTVAVVLRTATPKPADVVIWGTPTIYQPVTNAPIVIVYLIDTLAAQHLDLYGYQRNTAPNLRALSDRGVWFSNMTATSSATVTSVPSLLLGLTTERHRVVRSSAIAPLELVSMADAMRAAGFSTLSAVTNINAGPRQNMDQGFDVFVDRMSFHWSEGEDRTVPIDEVVSFMSRCADRPQFMYIHTAEPHGPYAPPPGFAGKFATGYSGPIQGTYDRKTGFFAAKTKEEVEHIISLYDEEILYADHRLGLFLQAVEGAGLGDRLDVFVLADHGEEFMQHGNWVHGRTLYQETIRVPLVAAGPMITARGKVDATVDLLDIMPTMLDMFELPEPYLLSGRSLLPALTTGGGKLPNKLAFSASYAFLRSNLVYWTLIEQNRWKLMYGPADNSYKYPDQKLSRWWLFDLQADPGEKKNVITAEPEVARRLLGALLAHFRRQHPYEMGAEHDMLKYDADQLRELRSLGYVGDAP